ncbi:MAG: hypothetical protein NC087_07000, partial [Anaeroplasma bactoclasticum]|nr:hypothetical protein [Anaeroplasma bactoclasticum]
MMSTFVLSKFNHAFLIKVEDYLNKAVSEVIKYCKEEGIGKIVVGWNTGIKEGGIKNKDTKG